MTYWQESNGNSQKLKENRRGSDKESDIQAIFEERFTDYFWKFMEKLILRFKKFQKKNSTQDEGQTPRHSNDPADI